MAYQTSGNVAVSDEEVRRFADFALLFNDQLQADLQGQTSAAVRSIEEALSRKAPGQVYWILFRCSSDRFCAQILKARLE